MLLDSIENQLDEMISLVETWGNINSHTANLNGIEKLIKEITPAFLLLKPDKMVEMTFPSSRGLYLIKREEAPLRIYLGGHIDTVFSQESPFQKVTKLNGTLRGPGITDMKGGLVVLLKSLHFFETLPQSHNMGWHIFLNSDEEIGSPESSSFIASCANKCHLACLFEPPLPDGALVSHRKGSANYHLFSQGKRAHAGRDPLGGKNAIYPLAKFITALEPMQNPSKGIYITVGLISGGEALNIIPERAECRINVRSSSDEELSQIDKAMRTLAANYQLEITRTTYRMPKILDVKTQRLIDRLTTCASQLGLSLTWKESGGVCDGNTLAACGVPTIDTMGVNGGLIHTEEEYLETTSLVEKTKLTVAFLNELAINPMKWVEKKEIDSL